MDVISLQTIAAGIMFIVLVMLFALAPDESGESDDGEAMPQLLGKRPA